MNILQKNKKQGPHKSFEMKYEMALASTLWSFLMNCGGFLFSWALPKMCPRNQTLLVFGWSKIGKRKKKQFYIRQALIK